MGRSIDLVHLSVDLLAQRVMQTGARDDPTTGRALQALLGLDPEPDAPWPSQSDVARWVNLTRARVGQRVGKLQQRWSKDPAVTKLRSDVAEILRVAVGVMSVGELSEAVLVARGLVQDEPYRSRLAVLVVWFTSDLNLYKVTCGGRCPRTRYTSRTGSVSRYAPSLIRPQKVCP